MIHGKSDALVGINHSRDIFNNFHHKTIKKLLEVDGDHNDYRSASDVNLIKEFIKQFSYDPLVLKEFKRRQLIQSSHNNFTEKNGIDINFVLSAFKNSTKDGKTPFKRSINNFNLLQNKSKKNNVDENRKLRSKSNDINLENLPDTKKDRNVSKPQKDLKTRNKSTNKAGIYDSNNIHQIKLKKFKDVEYNSNNVKIKSAFNNDYNSIKDEKQEKNSENSMIKDSFNFSFSTDTHNKHNKLRTERNNILGGILGCDMRIKSDQIKINTLDKSTFRKVGNPKVDISGQIEMKKK